MGSAPSKPSGTTVTKVKECNPQSAEKQTEESPEEVLRPGTVKETQTSSGGHRTKHKTQREGTSIDSRHVHKGASSDGVSRPAAKCVAGRQDSAIGMEEEMMRLRRCRPLHSKLPPIHYVEKNEGGLMVQDVEKSADQRKREVNKSPKTDRPSSATFPRKSQSQRPQSGTESPNGGLSLPDADHKPNVRPVRIGPVDPSAVGKLGVSGQELLQQLQRQGIVSVHGTHHVDSSTIIGQLAHLGLIRDSSSKGTEGGLVYNETERRKMPVRLARLNHSEVHPGAFPNPEEKRRRVRHRPNLGDCGLLMNEDVVNNAIQRACARERKQTKIYIPPDNDDHSKALEQKIDQVELL